MTKDQMEKIISDAGMTWDDLEYMSSKVHDDWNKQKTAEGWSYGETRDDANKKNPYLVDYTELEEEVKNWDRVTVCSVLQHLPKR
jgi:inorganic pyrophosphatase/exopolyphosphatase